MIRSLQTSMSSNTRTKSPAAVFSRHYFDIFANKEGQRQFFTKKLKIALLLLTRNIWLRQNDSH